ncbi:MAG: bestrophin family protein [Kofleriaceae bacterium]|nr:bestrophin family protein [Kofleriaceae bacterium]
MIEYDPHRWRSHFFDLQGSLVKEIAYRVGLVTLTAVFVAIAFHYHEDVAINGTPHALVGPALSLLLVFRTNTANDRYWEGRRLWGGVVNNTRNFRRKVDALFADEPATAQALVDWTVAFVFAMRGHLVREKTVGTGSRLSTEDQARALAAAHVPVYCASKLTAIIMDARRRNAISDIQQQMLDADVQALIDYLGACERIDTTPLPFAYAVHLRRILILYCATLPFALVSYFGEWTVLVSLLIAYILIGIEEIGTEIEGPFGRRENDLPLDRICERLQANLLAPENKA